MIPRSAKLVLDRDGIWAVGIPNLEPQAPKCHRNASKMSKVVLVLSSTVFKKIGKRLERTMLDKHMLQSAYTTQINKQKRKHNTALGGFSVLPVVERKTNEGNYAQMLEETKRLSLGYTVGSAPLDKVIVRNVLGSRMQPIFSRRSRGCSGLINRLIYVCYILCNIYIYACNYISSYSMNDTWATGITWGDCKRRKGSTSLFIFP